MVERQGSNAARVSMAQALTFQLDPVDQAIYLWTNLDVWCESPSPAIDGAAERSVCA